MNQTVALWFLFLDFRKSWAGPPHRPSQSAVLLCMMGLAQTEDKEKLEKVVGAPSETEKQENISVISLEITDIFYVLMTWVIKVELS